MKGTFKLLCAAVAAIIMIVPLAAFGEEIQIDTMSHTNADGAIGCGGGGQGEGLFPFHLLHSGFSNRHLLSAFVCLMDIDYAAAF